MGQKRKKHLKRAFKKQQNRTKKLGLPPGALVYVGENQDQETGLSLLSYSLADVSYAEKVTDWNEVTKNLSEEQVSWINLDGVAQTHVVEQVGNTFGIHNLVLEDILNTNQRPKIEYYEGYIFITTKMLSYNHENGSIDSEHISFVLKGNALISFQDKPGDVFNSIRERILHNKGKVRNSNATYLLSLLLDAIVEHYFLLLDHLSEKIEKLEEDIILNPSEDSLQEIHFLKKQLIFLKKSIQPTKFLLRDIVVENPDSFDDASMKYFGDIYDHAKEVSETVEAFREMMAHILEMYVTGISHKMNVVMKLLTVVATIFIPLTFIAGVYGMNFKWMPELEWKWGYPTVWLVMISIFIGSVTYFKKKDWL